MLIGDQSQFALECILSDRIQTFQYCRIRFFVRDSEIGDFSAQTTLGVCLHNAEIFLRFRGQRLVPEANVLSASELFVIYYASLFDPKSPRYRAALSENFSARFHIEEIGGESTREDYAIILIGVSKDRERIIIKNKSDWIRKSGEIYETEFSSGLVDSVVQEFLDWGKFAVKNFQ